MTDILMYKNFVGSVHFSSEDEIFHGKLTGVDDLVTFEGESVQNLKKAFEEAVDDYLALCETIGKSPTKSFKGSFNVRINPGLHKKAAYRSAEKGVSLNQFVEQAISEKVESPS